MQLVQDSSGLGNQRDAWSLGIAEELMVLRRPCGFGVRQTLCRLTHAALALDACCGESARAGSVGIAVR